MLLPRVIPCLLLKNQGLVKGVQFKNHQYVGDPINAIQIFNKKKVDEIIFLDITASQENRIPSIELIEKISANILTPFAVGGGIKTRQKRSPSYGTYGGRHKGVFIKHGTLCKGVQVWCPGIFMSIDPKVVTHIFNRQP